MSGRDPRDWVDDTLCHRRMFAESYFRWAPEDPYAIALTWTRGRLTYETLTDFRLLDRQILELNTYATEIDDAMAPRLAEAQSRCTRSEWGRGLEVVGLSGMDVQLLRHAAPARCQVNSEVHRVLRGIPLPNPFSQVWELRQLRQMYAAAEWLLEDAFCDLAVELVGEGRAWSALAEQTQRHGSEQTLRFRVEDQRELRGGPGDQRRHPVQTYRPDSQ